MNHVQEKLKLKLHLGIFSVSLTPYLEEIDNLETKFFLKYFFLLNQLKLKIKKIPDF